MFIYDPTFIMMIPAVLLALYAQFKVNSAFKKYSEVTSARGLTGAETAREILGNAGISDVSIEQASGRLTDHYDPKTKTLRLSEAVYNSKSLAAVGVAAHEVGHAIQHDCGYAPLGLRSAIVPAVNLGSNLAWPILLVGMILTSYTGEFGWIFVQIAIVLFTLVVIFSLITLPVEFNASSRAVASLQSNGILTANEITPVKKVLNAAAMTYVASAAMAIIQLLRAVLLSRRRR